MLAQKFLHQYSVNSDSISHVHDPPGNATQTLVRCYAQWPLLWNIRSVWGVSSDLCGSSLCMLNWWNCCVCCMGALFGWGKSKAQSDHSVQYIPDSWSVLRSGCCRVSLYQPWLVGRATHGARSAAAGRSLLCPSPSAFTAPQPTTWALRQPNRRATRPLIAFVSNSKLQKEQI